MSRTFAEDLTWKEIGEGVNKILSEVDGMVVFDGKLRDYNVHATLCFSVLPNPCVNLWAEFPDMGRILCFFWEPERGGWVSDEYHNIVFPSMYEAIEFMAKMVDMTHEELVRLDEIAGLTG